MMILPMTVHNCGAICAMVGVLAVSGCATAPRSTSGNAVGPPTAIRDPACVMPGPQCSVADRSYSREDIARTGATTAGRALQLLDPSITVTH